MTFSHHEEVCQVSCLWKLGIRGISFWEVSQSIQIHWVYGFLTQHIGCVCKVTSDLLSSSKIPFIFSELSKSSRYLTYCPAECCIFCAPMYTGMVDYDDGV
jgi:hypothetical protein